jgi:PAS domain S-box-containing protein
MPKRLAYLTALFVGLILSAAVVAALYADRQRHTQKVRLEVFHALSPVQNGFVNALNTRLQLATTLKTFIALDPDLDQATFAALASGLVQHMGGVRFVELARDDKISHVYPESAGPTVLGRDLDTGYSLEFRRAVSLAARTGRTQILPPMPVTEGGEAIVAVSPVSLGGAPWGTIVLLIDARTLFREAGLLDVSSRLDIAFRVQPDGGADRMVYGKASVFAESPVTMNISIPHGVWQVGAVPAGGWPASPNRPAIILGGVGLTAILTLSLVAVIALVMGRLSEREKYRSLVQNVRSIILRIDLDGIITFCNEHAEAFHGYAPGELIGKPLVGTLIPERGPEGEVMRRQLSRVLNDPSRYPFTETTTVRRNGEMAWISWANAPVPSPTGAMGELLCVGTDISDRKQVEEALRQSERQYWLLADNVTDVIWGTDADLRVTFVSRSDAELRGYDRRDILGRPVSEILTGPSRGRLDEAVDTLKAMPRDRTRPPSTTHDLEFVRADGGTVWLETRLGLLLNEGGDVVGVLGVGRDITDRKLAEALREDVERMARHDLKTPLGAVVGLPGEIARLGGLSEAQTAMLKTIEEAGETMLGLINRSLDLFKMERGTYCLVRKAVDVLDALERVKAESRFILREKGVSVGIEVVGGVPGGGLIVQAEEDLFRSMLSNLMINALQASPEGGFVNVTLSADQDLSIAIRNQGEVPTAIRETFFEKYVRSDASPGTGLGTYSARLVARTHGGDIVLDSSVPGETCVTVTLPLS